MNSTTSGSRRLYLTALLIFCGIALRLALPWIRHNFDIESWSIAADLVLDGKNVYANTWRHVYGPALLPLFALAKIISFFIPWQHPENFHFAVVCFLTAADLGICALLMKRSLPAAALLFFLNPVSILITGVHSQVDNLAILTGLGAWFLYEDRGRNPKYLLWSALLLGFSLTVKHNFIFLPFWLFFDPRWTNRREKVLYAGIVYFVFAASFVPFCLSEAGRAGVLKNVFQYSMGSGNALLTHVIQVFLPVQLLQIMHADGLLKYLFIGLLISSGRFIMKREPQNGLYLYLICLVVFSTQMADQYLAIPVLACAVFARNGWLIAFTVMSTLFLIGSPFNLHLWPRITPWPFLTSVNLGGLWWYYQCQIWLMLFLFARYFRMRDRKDFPVF